MHRRRGLSEGPPLSSTRRTTKPPQSDDETLSNRLPPPQIPRWEAVVGVSMRLLPALPYTVAALSSRLRDDRRGRGELCDQLANGDEEQVEAAGHLAPPILGA
ncbi:unnamed protein product [Lampetra fluviatilis]